jgi:hypothetical protein
MKLNNQWNKDKIKALCLDKFVIHKKYTEQLIENIQYNHDVDVLLKWIFVE